MKTTRIGLSLSLFVIIGLLSACNGCGSRNSNGSSDKKYQSYNTDSLTEERIKVQRDFLKQERDEINSFIKTKNWMMQRTGTGLYIQKFAGSPSGRTPGYGDYVTVDYSSYLLDGSRLYSSDSTGALKWRIEKDDSVPIGLHEAVLMLNEGDSARVILPSHLAYGIGGDQLKVPLKAAVLFKLRLISFSTP
jgi:FKBP-type peptidyl-prolyl cis-trans isomerase FkpA